MDVADPLTKAKLFVSNESGQWGEFGLGVVSVVTEVLPVESAEGQLASSSGGGKRGKAGEADGNTQVSARLQMFAMDSPSDLLLSSMVSLDDIYTLQGETILLWYDKSLGKEIACSFNTKDGCAFIYGQIKDYQQKERVRRVQDERLPNIADRFAVQPRNLAFILDAAETQNKRLGLYVRNEPGYFGDLAKLFHSSRQSGDTATMELVAKIVLALLQTPYSSEGKIIAQFVENESVDSCIDIVQYGLGRRDKASGFISFEERRATFHDPCNLPSAMKTRIHVLYSSSFLKDMIPLSLDAADAASCSLLSTFTLRFTVATLTELCSSPTILPRAFQQAVEAVQLDPAGAADAASIEPSKVEHLFELAAFVGDVAKTIKNTMMGIDIRTELFSSLVHVGLLPFLTAVLECALRYYDPPPHYPVQQWLVQPPRAVQLVCDSLYGCATNFPECVEDLVADASQSPQRCLLRLLLHAATVVTTSAEAQSVVDAVQCCGVGVPLTLAMFGDNAQLEARRHEVLRFWIEGNIVERPPLFHLATHLVSLLGDGVTPAGGSASLITATSTATTTAAPPAPSPSTAAASASGAMELSPVAERQVTYGLRIITAILTKIDTTRCSSFVEVMTLSKLLPALATTLDRPLRRLANLQSSVTSFIAAALERRDGRLVGLVTGDSASLLDAALRLFLQCCHRDNILSSSLGHLLSAVCDGVHREKLNSSSTLGSVGSIASSPYITLLRGDDSISKTEANAPASPSAARPFESAAAAVLARYGGALAVAAPVLHGRLQRALEETPEQAQQAEAETSSLASSVDRAGLSALTEFDAADIDFGFEPPLRTVGLEAVTEERLSSLTRSLTTSDEDDEGEGDDDPLAELSSIEADSDDEEADATATAVTGLKAEGQATAAVGGGGAAALSPAVSAVTAAPADGLHSPSVSAAVVPDSSLEGSAVLLSPPLSSSPSAAGGAAVSTSQTSPPPTASSVSMMAGLESVDSPSGRGSLLEDEENRLPKRLSVKRGRADTDRQENEEEEAELKRMRAEESAA